MIKFFAFIIMTFVALLAASLPASAAPVGNAQILDRVTAAVETDSRWRGAVVEVSDLDLSALERHGKVNAVRGFDAVKVEFLGQVRPGKRFTMKVVFLKDGKKLTDLLAMARISLFRDVVVAMRSLRIRDKVGGGDVRIERMQLREIDAPVFVSVADVVGMRVRRPIRAGAYIKKGYIQPETTIRREIRSSLWQITGF